MDILYMILILQLENMYIRGVLCLYGGCSGMPMLPTSFAVAKKPHTQVMSMTTIES